MVVKKGTVRCYVTLLPFAAEPVLQAGQSWWQTLPPTQTRESNQNKRTHQSLEDEIPDEPISMSLPELVMSHDELGFGCLISCWIHEMTNEVSSYFYQ
jgi:hypothetical protein